MAAPIFDDKKSRSDNPDYPPDYPYPADINPDRNFAYPLLGGSDTDSCQIDPYPYGYIRIRSDPIRWQH